MDNNLASNNKTNKIKTLFKQMLTKKSTDELISASKHSELKKTLNAFVILVFQTETTALIIQELHVLQGQQKTNSGQQNLIHDFKVKPAITRHCTFRLNLSPKANM